MVITEVNSNDELHIFIIETLNSRRATRPTSEILVERITRRESNPREKWRVKANVKTEFGKVVPWTLAGKVGKGEK